VLADSQIPRRLSNGLLSIRGALIDSTIDLSGGVFSSALQIEGSRIEGDLVLANSRWSAPLGLTGTVLAGALLARRLKSESLVSVADQSTVAGNVDLRDARIAHLELDASSFASGIAADRLAVSGTTSVSRGSRVDGPFTLGNGRLDSDLDLSGSMFSDTVDFDSAKVNVDLIMLSATIAGNLNLFGVFVGSGLATDHADFRGDVVLRNASVGKTLSRPTPPLPRP
jgi:hypothetical protein